MSRGIAGAIAVIMTAAVVGIGCAEEMVGAPCTPETDKGDFNASIEGITYSIETRSVQCETRICVTKTELYQWLESADVAACEGSGEKDDCEGTQLKQSFCSCRCKDENNHTYQSNPDKYDYLCECPPNTLCEEVLTGIEEAPDKIKGSYCIPKCIANPCIIGEICTPSKDPEAPWNWKCKDVD